MKRLMITALVIACASTLWAAAPGSFANRTVAAFTNSIAVTNSWSRGNPVQVASVTVAYSGPTTNTLFVVPVLTGTAVERAVTESFTNQASVVFLPTALWLKAQDSLCISNLVSAPAVAIIDYIY